jgi:hypothetical protein
MGIWWDSRFGGGGQSSQRDTGDRHSARGEPHDLGDTATRPARKGPDESKSLRRLAIRLAQSYGNGLSMQSRNCRILGTGGGVFDRDVTALAVGPEGALAQRPPDKVRAWRLSHGLALRKSDWQKDPYAEGAPGRLGARWP